MLRMSDLPPRHIRDANRKAELERLYGVNPAPQQKPAEVIRTISDHPKRDQIVAEAAQEQVQEILRDIGPFNGEPLPILDGVNAHHADTMMEPRRFSNVMRNGAWRGRRAFIVGGGPSLKEFDWGLLKGELTIGVNRAFEKFDPSIMFSMDARLLDFIENGKLGPEAKERYYNYKGNRVWSSMGMFFFPPEVYVVERPNPQPKTPVTGTVECLDVGNNSGYGALNLAVALGADPIYLLGFDMKGDGKGKQVWWHDGYPDKQNESVYTGFIQGFNKFAKVLKGHVDVVNLNKDSALKCFPFGDAKEVLADKDTRFPVVVSYYTEGTGYQREAYRLMESLHRHGIEYDIPAVPDKGGWHQNTLYKAEFMEGMLGKHKNRPLLWLDADAVVQQYPDKFPTLKTSVAVHVVDWSQYPGVRRNDTEVLSGTVFVKNNIGGRKLVRAWVKEVQDNPQVTDQVSLGKALQVSKVPYTNLPATYCQIFDTMATAGDSVIEHFQASRRLRR